MVVTPILFICFWGLSSAILFDTISNSQRLPRVDTYVVNLDSRTDRCQCMSSQLANAPQNVFRHRAAEAEDCPEVQHSADFEEGRPHQEAERSLFCSNYQIWQRALHTKADFIVILEDDAQIKPRFWSKLFQFVSTCKHFDYVLVDPLTWNDEELHFDREFWHKNSEPVESCADGGEATGLYRQVDKKPEYRSWHTTTMTIVRKAYLPKLIRKAERHGWGAMDDWWQIYVQEDATAYGWAGNITTQMSVGRQQLVEAAVQESGCSPDVMESNIGAGSITAVQRRHVDGDAIARLSCPLPRDLKQK